MNNRRVIKWSLTGPTSVEAGGDVPVWVSVVLIETSWQKNIDHYVGSGGTGSAIEGRYEKLDAKMSQGGFASLDMPQLVLDKDGLIEFSDGRHRFAWLRDHYVVAIQVQVPPNQEEIFVREFGTDVRVSDYLPSKGK